MDAVRQPMEWMLTFLIGHRVAEITTAGQDVPQYRSR